MIILSICNALLRFSPITSADNRALRTWFSLVARIVNHTARHALLLGDILPDHLFAQWQLRPVPAWVLLPYNIGHNLLLLLLRAWNSLVRAHSAYNAHTNRERYQKRPRRCRVNWGGTLKCNIGKIGYFLRCAHTCRCNHITISSKNSPCQYRQPAFTNSLTLTRHTQRSTLYTGGTVQYIATVITTLLNGIYPYTDRSTIVLI